jgi:hypothetical protein
MLVQEDFLYFFQKKKKLEYFWDKCKTGLCGWPKLQITTCNIYIYNIKNKK